MGDMSTEHFSPYRADGKLVSGRVDWMGEEGTDEDSMASSVLLLVHSSRSDRPLSRSWPVSLPLPDMRDRN